MSRILCIIDGMTDPHFSVSDYPHLTTMKCTGLIDTTKGGQAESLNCILHLLGVDCVPQKMRGYVEALAEDIPVTSNDLIFRGSWFSVDEHGRCAEPIEGLTKLEDKNDLFRYYHIDQYKAILVFPGLAPYVDHIVTRPPYGCTGAVASCYKPSGHPSLEICFDRWLQNGRCLIPWGESVCATILAFPQKSAVVCGTAVVKGIAMLLQMDNVTVVGATGDTDTNLSAKVAASLSAAEQYPFVLLHINGADEASHRCNTFEKQAFIRKIDQTVLSELLASQHEIIVVSDHGTDPETGRHIGEDQPVFTNYKEK